MPNHHVAWDKMDEAAILSEAQRLQRKARRDVREPGRIDAGIWLMEEVSIALIELDQRRMARNAPLFPAESYARHPQSRHAVDPVPRAGGGDG